ncbi:hypothetical protein [Spartinivicinus ruber]|uniref:hypothetical protein n=1 Tax=Spartinivicinus ruber TaxID=2683272 RepID=UPI0013D380B3|nr:hypothetical protein [Spartinivicinus ruber]
MKENLTAALQGQQQNSSLLQWAAQQRFIAVGIPVLALLLATLLLFSYERNVDKERVTNGSEIMNTLVL